MSNKRALALDYGLRRTGLALSDALGIVAQPLHAVHCDKLPELVQTICQLVHKEKIAHVVLGIPFMPDGTEGDQAKQTRLFQTALLKSLPADVILHEIDERYTSKEADSLMKDAGMKSKKRKEFRDSTAAVVMLREWLSLN